MHLASRQWLGRKTPRGTTLLRMLILLIFLTFTEICAAQNDSGFTVFAVTSKSVTVQWNIQAGASSYKITATPKNSPEPSAFAQFGGNTVMGSINSLSPNTVYTLQLEAMDNTFNVLSSAEMEETTAPEIPSIEQAYSKQSDSITVEFTEVSGATSYILRAESETGDFFSESVVSSSPGTVVELKSYTDYRLSIMSVNSGGRSQPSLHIEVKTVVPPPELNTTSPANGTIRATWTPVEHADLYLLCIIREGSSHRHKLNTTDTTVTFDDLEAGVNYCIQAMSMDPQGRTGDDTTVCQITRPPIPDVTYIEISQGRTEQMRVYWTSVQGAEQYEARSTNGQGCMSDGQNHCLITPVECGQNHSITVKAYNKGGASNESDPKGYLTYPCLPDHIQVKEPIPGNCTVEWNPVELADFYKTYWKMDDGTEKSCNTTETKCQFVCKCGCTYYASVFPHNQAGSSHSHRVHNYTTIPCCPQDVAVHLVSTETLEVKWPPVKGADLYQTTAAQTNNVIHCNDTSSVCALSDLKCNTVYSVTVTPCSELSGCNRTCGSSTHETAPCAPEILDLQLTNDSMCTVAFSTPNTNNTDYTVTASGRSGSHTCHTRGSSCNLTHLPCGSTYEVMAVATTAVGSSLPGFSKTLETGPCCPEQVNVSQVTQAVSNVTWSHSSTARSYVTSLTSSHGHAKCHTTDNHCLMGCITCGTNYSISMEAISSTGHKSECHYKGFSSSPCCPTGVKILRRANNSLRAQWRPLGPQTHNHTVHLYGKGSNHSCTASAGYRYCDVQNAYCGDIFQVVVAPVKHNGEEVSFCNSRNYSISCSLGNSMVMRGRRSLY